MTGCAPFESDGTPAEVDPPAPGGQWMALCLLLVAMVMLDLVLLAMLQAAKSEWPSWTNLVAIGLSFAQLGAASALLVFGPGGILSRGTFAMGLTLAAGLLGARGTGIDPAPWLGYMFIDMFIAAAPLMVLRLLAVQLVCTGQTPLPLAAVRQFSIWSILSITTLIAATLGIARFLHFPASSLLQAALFVSEDNVITWHAVLLILSPIPRRWLLTGLLVWPLVGLITAFSGFAPSEIGLMVRLCIVQGAATMAICGIVRLAGYRLHWHGPLPKQAIPQSGTHDKSA
jgi:hypothetical protein